MGNRRAFMKTVEAFMAIMLAFTFVIFFMPTEVRTIDDQSVFRLQHLEHDDVFRQCVLDRDEECIDDTMDRIFENRYAFDYVIYEFSEPEVIIEEEVINVYSWFFAGTREEFKPMHFKLFYWDRDFQVDSPLEFLPPGNNS